MSTRAILFDLFGTLVQPLNGKRLLSRLVEEGIDIENEGGEWIARGYPAGKLVVEMGVSRRVALDLHLALNLPSVTSFVDFLRTYERNALKPCSRTIEETETIFEICIHEANLVKGAEGVLDELRAQGVMLQLLSNTTTLYAQVIDRLGLKRWFSAPVLSCETGILKPNAQAFQLAAAQLGLDESSYDEVMMVGDTWRSDILGAIACGMRATFINMKTSSLFQHLINDVRPFLELDFRDKVAVRENVRETLRPFLPMPIEAIEDSPTNFLEVDSEGHLRLAAFKNITVIKELASLPSLLKWS